MGGEEEDDGHGENCFIFPLEKKNHFHPQEKNLLRKLYSPVYKPKIGKLSFHGKISPAN